LHLVSIALLAADAMSAMYDSIQKLASVSWFPAAHSVSHSSGASRARVCILFWLSTSLPRSRATAASIAVTVWFTASCASTHCYLTNLHMEKFLLACFSALCALFFDRARSS
jgi:hypothetical protein